VTTLRLSVLDQSPVPSGSTPADALRNSIALAQHVESLGYTRFWMSEHHSMELLACTAPEIMLARIGAETSRIRLGSGGIMLPHYTPFKVAETFRTLHALYPGRIDLGIGRAPGGGPIETTALRHPARRLPRPALRAHRLPARRIPALAPVFPHPDLARNARLARHLAARLEPVERRHRRRLRPALRLRALLLARSNPRRHRAISGCFYA
jgi:hypothetical protein